jgi:hypothetical protein
MKLSRGGGLTWEKDDDIAPPGFFVWGGGSWWQLGNKGGVEWVGWQGDRVPSYKSPWPALCAYPAGPPSRRRRRVAFSRQNPMTAAAVLSSFQVLPVSRCRYCGGILYRNRVLDKGEQVHRRGGRNEGEGNMLIIFSNFGAGDGQTGRHRQGEKC